MDLQARIYVAGAGDRAGSDGLRPGSTTGRAILRRLESLGLRNLVCAGEPEPDLLDRGAVDRLFAATRPDYVFVTAGQTAGIGGNQQLPADLMIDNLLIASHLIPAAWKHGAKKLLYLSSSCAYPKAAPQPLDVASLWTGVLEPTSAAYATAKLAGIKLSEAYRQQYGAPFITAIAADAYGPEDDFGPEHSHVVGALIQRMHEAKVTGSASATVWGSGTPRREFIYVDDLADACVFAMREYNGIAPINLGSGEATSIADLAEIIRGVVGYPGALLFDPSKPDGMPFKGLDSTPLWNMGWRPSVDLRTGLEKTYQGFLERTSPRT